VCGIQDSTTEYYRPCYKTLTDTHHDLDDADEQPTDTNALASRAAAALDSREVAL